MRVISAQKANNYSLRRDRDVTREEREKEARTAAEFQVKYDTSDKSAVMKRKEVGGLLIVPFSC